MSFQREKHDLTSTCLSRSSPSFHVGHFASTLCTPFHDCIPHTWGICNNNNNNINYDPDWGICTRRAGKLYKARSRLYRSQILQVNTRWKALAEIYTMHSFAPLWNRIPKNEENHGGGKDPGPIPGK